MRITQIVNENALKCKKNALQSFRHCEFHQNLCEELKKGLHSLDALRELEMLVADLIRVNMPHRLAIDSQAFKDRPVDCDLLVGQWTPLIYLYMSLC